MAKKAARKREARRKLTMATIRIDAAREAFLAAIQEEANITDAAKKAGIARSTHYVWIKDPVYRKRFLEARESAYDRLELEAWRRAFAGSDRLLMFLLSAYRARFRPDAQPPMASGDDLVDVPDDRLEAEAEEEVKKLGFASLNELWRGTP